MTNAIAYRGPDDEGAWAIIGLSPEGYRPTRSASRRHVTACKAAMYSSAAIGQTPGPRARS